MQKREFEEMVEQPVSDAEYRVIETVYQWHPSVKEVSGKEEVAELYKSFGMAIFYDMLPRAERNCELEKQLRQIQAEDEQIRQERGALARGSSLEREETATEMQEKHGIKQMLKVMDETLTGYLSDPQVTKACKKRMKLCMVRSIEEIYSAIVQD